MAVVDGFTGTLYVEPSQEVLAEMTKKQEKLSKEKELLQELKGKEDVTVDGR